jgi:hypothetical protein
MDILKELLEIITPSKLKKINLIIDLDDESMLKRMYNGYQDSHWKNDDEAAKILYGDDYKKDTFFKLKHDLTKRLIQIFPLINLLEDEDWEHRKAAWECYTTFHVANMMARLTNASAVAKEMMERIFEKCLYYEFTDLIIAIAPFLSAKYKSVGADRAKAQHYEDIVMDYLMIQIVETKGQLYIAEIFGYYNKNKSVKPFVPVKALEYLNALEAYDIKNPTQKIWYFKKLLEVMHFMTKYNYKKTVEVCNEAILFFESQAFVNRGLLRTFYFQAIASHTYRREFDEGYAKVEKCLILVEDGNYNWFKAQELCLHLALYSKRYQEAYKILRTVMTHKRFNKMPHPLRQWWILNEGFIFLLKKIGLIIADEGDLMHLRFQSFINKIPVWSGDKRGLNFSIHILYLFYLITKKEDKSYDKYMDKMDSLRQYARRHADDEEMKRSRWIVSILEQVGNLGFMPRNYANNALIKESLEGLIKDPYDITDSNLDVEPIPFQDVYGYIDLILDNKITIEKYEF